MVKYLARQQKLAFQAFVTLTCLTAFQAYAAAPGNVVDETYMAENGLLYSEPVKSGEKIAKLKAGVRLEVLSYSTSKPWARVRTPAGREGWVLVRDTVLVGRRDEPLLPREEENGGDRSPATVDNFQDGDEELIAQASDDNQEEPKQPARPVVRQRGKQGLGSLIPTDKKFFIKVGGDFSYQAYPFAAGGPGAQVGFEYHFNTNYRVGLGGYWNYFTQSKISGANRVDRNANHFLIGPEAAAHMGPAFLQLTLGLDITRSRITFLDSATGARLPIGTVGDLTGTYNESAFGMRLSAGYEFKLESLKARVYSDYALGFYKGTSLVAGAGTTPIPQHWSLGALVLF